MWVKGELQNWGGLWLWLWNSSFSFTLTIVLIPISKLFQRLCYEGRAAGSIVSSGLGFISSGLTTDHSFTTFMPLKISSIFGMSGFFEWSLPKVFPALFLLSLFLNQIKSRYTLVAHQWRRRERGDGAIVTDVEVSKWPKLGLCCTCRVTVSAIWALMTASSFWGVISPARLPHWPHFGGRSSWSSGRKYAYLGGRGCFSRKVILKGEAWTWRLP